MTSFNYYYKTIITQDLINKFNYKTYNHIPYIKKMTLNIGWKQPETRNLLASLLAIELITSQKAVPTRIKNLDLSLKIKKGLPTGCKVTLRSYRIYEFTFRLTSEILPRLNQINDFNYKKLSNLKSLTFSLTELLNFTELETNYFYFKNIAKLDVTITLKANQFNEVYFLLKSLKFPFH